MVPVGAARHVSKKERSSLIDSRSGVKSERRLQRVACLFMPVDDATPRKVVWREFHHHSIAWKDSYVVHSHFSGDVSQDLLSGVELHSEGGIRKRLDDRPFDFYRLFFLRHVALSLNRKLKIAQLSSLTAIRRQSFELQCGQDLGSVVQNGYRVLEVSRE
jgi:hypothetical protein